MNIEKIGEVGICLVCGTSLEEFNNNSDQVDGRLIKSSNLICTTCYWQCLSCGDWYSHENTSVLALQCPDCPDFIEELKDKSIKNLYPDF